MIKSKAVNKKHIIAAMIFIMSLSPGLDSYAQLNIKNYIELGKRSLFQGNYQESIKRFNAVIEINQQLYQPYFFRGVAKFNLGDIHGARKDFTHSLELHPYFSHAYHYRGISQERLNNYYSAITDYNSAIDINPVNPDFYSSRGFTRVLLNDTSGAMNDFNEAIMIDHNNYQAWLNRSLVWSMMEEYDKALDDCNRAIKINKYSINSFYRRGLIYYNNSDFDKALEDFDLIIRMDSTDARAFYYRALTRYRRNEIEGALSDYNRVIELDPLNALTYYNRGILRTNAGDLQGAIMDYNKVIDLNPSNIFAWFNRGTVRLGTGDHEKAISDFSRVIELYPGFTRAYINRSVAKSRINDLQGAEQDRRMAEQISIDSTLQMSIAGRVDSSYFNKLIELKANFDNGNITGSEMEIMASSIKMKSTYKISLVDKKHKDIIFNKDIEDINTGSRGKFKLGLLQAGEPGEGLQAGILNSEKTPEFITALAKGDMHDFNSAFEHMNRALKKDPDNFLYIFGLASLKFSLRELMKTIDIKDDYLMVADREKKTKLVSDPGEELNDMIKHYDRILVLDPDFAPAWYNRAYLRSMNGDIAGAMNDYDISIALADWLPEAWYNRGLIHIYLKDTEKGCNDLSVAGELGMEEAYFAINKYCR